MADIGSKTIVVIITNNIKNYTDTFIVKVNNYPPNLSESYQTPFNAVFGKDSPYTLPKSADPEGLLYTTTILTGPSFVSLPSGSTQLSIYPINCNTDFGDHKVTIKLEDEEPKSTTYDITVNVPNLPPEFSVNQL